MGVTRATMSHGVRWTTSRLESLRTTALSTAKSSAEAVDIAATTARRTSAACIFPPSGAVAKPRATYVGVTQESQGALKTHRPHNRLAFSCGERVCRALLLRPEPTAPPRRVREFPWLYVRRLN